MGNAESKVEEEFFSLMFIVPELSDIIPDIGIDLSLVKYSRLNSAAELETSITHVLQDIRSRILDFVQNLGSAFATFKRVPNAASLGAVALSIAS